MKHFISIQDAPDLDALIAKAMLYKENPNIDREKGKYKTLGLLFFNSSLRTRLSTEIAANNLGMQVIGFSNQQAWNFEFMEGAVMDQQNAEHIKEAAGVLSRYVDILGVRSFPELVDRAWDYSEPVLSGFQKNLTIPLVNLESATLHPLQSLADLMTIRELQQTKKPKVVLSWAPHPRALPQSVPNSFAACMLAAGMDLTITHPEGLELSSDFTEGATITHNQQEAFEGADFIYAKNWSSFREYGKGTSLYSDWIIDGKKMKATNDAHFMHCLPVRRNVVVADEVLDSPKSVVLQQAQNRIFTAQAVLSSLLDHGK
jgi:N-succinyl-L-ornithine transcarbamylase